MGIVQPREGKARGMDKGCTRHRQARLMAGLDRPLKKSTTIGTKDNRRRIAQLIVLHVDGDGFLTLIDNCLNLVDLALLDLGCFGLGTAVKGELVKMRRIDAGLAYLDVVSCKGGGSARLIVSS